MLERQRTNNSFDSGTHLERVAVVGFCVADNRASNTGARRQLGISQKGGYRALTTK
jgi:hypothetical protein